MHPWSVHIVALGKNESTVKTGVHFGGTLFITAKEETMFDTVKIGMVPAGSYHIELGSDGMPVLRHIETRQEYRLSWTKPFAIQLGWWDSVKYLGVDLSRETVPLCLEFDPVDFMLTVTDERYNGIKGRKIPIEQTFGGRSISGGRFAVTAIFGDTVH